MEQQQKKRIAIVTNFFYPIKYIGANRMEAFAEYLSNEFEVVVFAEHHQLKSNRFGENVQVYYNSSSWILEVLKNKNTDNKLVHNFKTLLNIMIRKVITKPLLKWKEKTLRQLEAVHSKDPFDVIISSFPYMEAHLVSIDFCKNHPEVKWIADMRDEMSFNPNHSKAINDEMRAIEQQIDNLADAVVSVSEPILSTYKTHLKNVKIAEEIRNGFNHDLKFDVSIAKTPVLKLGYFGSFYGDIKPTNLFKALAELPEDFQFEMHIYGAFSNFTVPNEIKARVFVYPSLSYKDAISKMNTMDANVVIHPTTQRKGVYTGKLFDYISARKPILALMDESDVAAQLIHSFGCGYVCDNSAISEIKEQLLAIQQDKLNQVAKVASQENIDSLHRSRGVKALKQIIQRIFNENPASRS
ncbi:MAG: hypothetical protein IT221_01635 [Fluviicola sp.]|nr:hypothetical protein [Fluviicola sp.]